MDDKIPLPEFLTALTRGGIISAKNAMLIAGKIYKAFNTRSRLKTLDDSALQESGLEDHKDLRKQCLIALANAGYTGKLVEDSVAQKSRGKRKRGPAGLDSLPSTSMAGKSPGKKRKSSSSQIHNEFFPDEEADIKEFEWLEVLDEKKLAGKMCTINRAPLLMAWTMLVAERMGFLRAEALSIASVVTEINAVSKGVSLGIYKEDKDTCEEHSEAQQFVDIIGRRPLFRTHESQWRALLKNVPQNPVTPFSYISRAFQDAAPYIIGALSLLAASLPSQELNSRAWSLYCEFRPAVNEWGARAEVQCDTILALRKGKLKVLAKESAEEKGMSLEEYEVMLDEDHSFDDILFTGP